MSLDNLMHRPRDRWLVSDLTSDGIRPVANDRAQLNTIIRTLSAGALVRTLGSRGAEFPATGVSRGAPVR
jgi:hypothetical protein